MRDDFRTFIKNCIFAITLTYNRVRIACFGWNYYDEIVEKVYLGVIPLAGTFGEISKKAKWVVSAVEPLELKRGLIYEPKVPDEPWRCNVPMVDFGGKMDCKSIDRAVEFIHAHKSEGVYVHCKAGRTRSATVMACYLLKYEKALYDLQNPVESVISYIKSRRPQILINDVKKETIQEYYLTEVRAIG